MSLVRCGFCIGGHTFKRLQPFKQGRPLESLQTVFMLPFEQQAPRASVGAACSEANVQIRRKEQQSAPRRF
jgi:hypothetical protein